MSTPARRELIASLCAAHGPSGHEEAVREIVRPLLTTRSDEVTRDALGNLTGVRRGPDGAPRLMVCAHMDEIGLAITHIEERGYLRFVTVGGWDARTLVGQRVVVHGREPLAGVIGTAAVHTLDEAAKNRVPKIDELAIDVGLPGDRVRDLVRAGDMATRTRDVAALGDLITGKSLDDRVGVAVMLEALAAAGTSGCEVHAVASCQEEVGLRGAGVAAERISPHIALAIDTCPAEDGPGTPTRGASTRVGAGAAIRVMDASAICDPALVDLLVEIADARGIPRQFHVANKGGTDTGAMQRASTGAIAGCVSIPTRYIHSSVESCHPDDIDAAVALVAGFIEEAHRLVATR